MPTDSHRLPHKKGNPFARLNPQSLIEQWRKGVAWKTFTAFRKQSILTDAEWAMLLGITPRTLQRYKEEEKTFGSAASEKMLWVTEILNKAKEVFGDKEKVSLWLRNPIIALGVKEPSEFFDTISALQYLLDELGRIEHGVFA